MKKCCCGFQGCLYVSGETAVAVDPGKEALHTHRCGTTTKPDCPAIILTISTVMLVTWVTRQWL